MQTWMNNRWPRGVAMALCMLAAGCGGDDEAAPIATTARTIATTAAQGSTPPTAATTPTTSAAAAGPATTAVAAGGYEALLGLWFFECDDYIPGDGATSGVFEIVQSGPEQITIDVQGYRYGSPDCSDEPVADAANVLVFDVVGVTQGPNGTEYAFIDAGAGFPAGFSLGADGVLTVDGDPMTRSVDFNTAYD